MTTEEFTKLYTETVPPSAQACACAKCLADSRTKTAPMQPELIEALAEATREVNA